jgi:hypothetical protein
MLNKDFFAVMHSKQKRRSLEGQSVISISKL